LRKLFIHKGKEGLDITFKNKIHQSMNSSNIFIDIHMSSKNYFSRVHQYSILIQAIWILKQEQLRKLWSL